MWRWKKEIGIVLLCSLVFCMAGCTGGRNPQKNDKRLKVVATVFAEYDFLRNIAGDRISLEMLMLPGADLHAFDPTPKDIMQVHSKSFRFYPIIFIIQAVRKNITVILFFAVTNSKKVFICPS